MRCWRIAPLLITAALGAFSCTHAQSPTGPSSTESLDGRTVAQVEVSCPDDGVGTQCSATALFANNTVQDIRGLATWTTSDSAIATVNSTGVVTAHRTGEVAIRAAYRGVEGFALVWIQPGMGLRGTYRTLTGIVIDAAGTGPVGDVAILILDGPNASRTTTTYGNGVFLMEGLQDGSFTVRLSKSGYTTAEYVWWIPGSRERIVTLRKSP